jgi:probable phosphoglycerate mutase
MVGETEFILIRHGQSVWNAVDRWQGHGDPPLSDEGRRQVAELAQVLAGEGVDRVISSDLLRAAETADILSQVWKLVPARDPRLRELDVGAWTGLTRSQIEELAGDELRRFDLGEPELRAGGGESRHQLRVRVRTAASEIAARHPGERIALVTHLGAVRALLPGTELPNAGWCRAQANELAPPPAVEVREPA